MRIGRTDTPLRGRTLHKPLLHLLPDFEKRPGPQFGEVSVVAIQRASLKKEAASSQLVAHTLACMRAARQALTDLRAGATSGQTSSMARAQLLLALHCLVPLWCKPLV